MFVPITHKRKEAHMATAGLVIRIMPGGEQPALAQIRIFPGVADVRPVPGSEHSPCFAVVLDSPSVTLKRDMEHLAEMPQVQAVDVAYISYEDDLEESGSIPCPPSAHVSGFHSPRGEQP